MNTTSSLGQDKAELSVRIVVCDHYITRPIPGIDVIYSEFRGSDIKQVPVLRIFGSAQDGHKTCLHIHGVFPYFYIPCPVPNPQPQFLYQIAASLDKSLNIALKQATSANQHVYKISLVKGLPFYGFHDKEHLYLKVFLYNPGLIKQAVELFSNGAILGQTFQPHESHLNFTLQFFIDFNLFGMSNIDLQTVKYRKSGQSQSSNDILIDSDDNCLKPESVCYYEADCVASHIINRQRIGKGDGIENPGLEEVWNQERERRKQLNVSIGSKTLSQGRINNEETETHKKFEQMFLIKMSNLVDKPVAIDCKDLGPVNYPAESLEGSQLFDAVDVSMHLPDTTLRTSFSETAKRIGADVFSQDLDETLVDENVALNSSLHYSQVLLNSEDFELLDMLQDLDEKPVDEDSVIRTSADIEEVDSESEDTEYSQVYHDDTIVLDPDNKTNESESTSSSWNDTFWDGANIPQLDGTFDDDHVKKVRKRKMRPLKVGLSRPKSKKPESGRQSNKMETEPQISESDEINESRETLEDFTDLHLKRSIKMEKQSLKGEINTDNSIKESITSLVHKFSKDQDILSQKVAKAYDEANKYIPQAGSSSVGNVLNGPKNCDIFDSSISESLELCDSKLGIESFYTSKIFDDTVNSDNVENICDHENQDVNDIKIESNNSSSMITLKLEYIEDDSFDKSNGTYVVMTPKIRPPTKSYVISTLKKYNIPYTKNPVPFFSNYKDVGEKIEVGQLMLKIRSRGAKDQKVFGNVLDVTSLEEWRQLLFLQSNEIAEEGQVPESLDTLLAGRRQCVIQPVFKAPLKSQVEKWITENKNNNNTPEIKIDDVIVNDLEELDNSQALGLNEDEINCSIQIQCSDKEKSDSNSMQITMQPDGSFLCFGGGEIEKDNSEPQTVEVDFLTVMLLEVHASVRGELNPDPALDSIQAIFVKITNDCPPNHFLTKSSTEIIVFEDSEVPEILDKCIFNSKVTYVKSENDLLEKVIEMVKHHDPDILCGYEIEMNSWGYVIERSQILGLEIIKEISRITEKNRQKRWFADSNEYERRVIGRIMFNVWRLFRHELALSSYSFENCMYEILKERVPSYSCAQLAAWWMEGSKLLRWMPVEYYLTRLSGTVRMMEKLDFINRTSELARLFGLQWWEVLSRGSQFRVESLMLRAARPLNLVALSPTVKQRAAMKAPECLPLIFEPESRFYTDPVIVLDFQSLYPSMMIAYNYCFSTCIGRVQNINGESAYEFGAWRLRIPKCKLEALVKNGLVHWSPVGAGFVKPAVRRGVLPALLRRILAARQAVKKGMKLQKDEAVKKAMHSRQLGLKLIANVTYGYTAANFSGRMPCVELGDSVVAKGRETLERAIKLVNDSHWNAKVIYGDTDSMFVLVPGGTRAQAFQIGQQIADAVTADNPSPVALKLEKVYQPCILQTKKRYVGYMYETNEQETPVYEAKGIETVRRDGCPAGVKLLRRALCELFESHDMSRVKRSVTALLSRLMDGTLPVHELFFTREYHGPNGYRPGASAPPIEIAKRLSRRDPRLLPARGWRVSWLIAGGAPGAPLLQLAREPGELRRELAAPLVPYYATRVLLPPLHRCLALLGADVFKWWQELGYTRLAAARAACGGISRFMWRARCALCGSRCQHSVCAQCIPSAAAAVTAQAAVAKTHDYSCQMICRSCSGHAESSKCSNTECPVLWRKITAKQSLDRINEIIRNLPPQLCQENWSF